MVWLTFDATVVVTGGALVVVTGALAVVGVLDVEVEATVDVVPALELDATRFFVGAVVVGDDAVGDVIPPVLELVGLGDVIDPSEIFAGVV